jgi:hypothetical protein
MLRTWLSLPSFAITAVDLLNSCDVFMRLIEYVPVAVLAIRFRNRRFILFLKTAGPASIPNDENKRRLLGETGTVHPAAGILTSKKEQE